MQTEFNEPKPTDRELEILNVLWRTGPATVRQVYEDIKTQRQVEYCTVLKFMQIMKDKRLLIRDKIGHSHVYRPAQAKDSVRSALAAQLLATAFDGSFLALLKAVLGLRQIPQTEMAEVQKLIGQASTPYQEQSACVESL